MDEVEKEPNLDAMNPDAIEDALGDGYIEIEDDEIIMLIDDSDDDELDIAFSHDDPKDWY